MLIFSRTDTAQTQKFAGIGPDDTNTFEQGEDTEQERKLVRDVLISAYDKNISTRLRAELCSLDINNYNYTKDATTSKSPPPPSPIEVVKWCNIPSPTFVVTSKRIRTLATNVSTFLLFFSNL